MFYFNDFHTVVLDRINSFNERQTQQKLSPYFHLP